MSLAYHGKSTKRRGYLAGLGLFAVFAAIIGGLIGAQTTRAHHLVDTASATCTTWSASLGFTSGTAALAPRMVLMLDVRVNGEAYQPSWSTAVTAPVAFNIPDSAFASQDDIDSADGTSRYQWIDAAASWTVYNRSNPPAFTNGVGDWGGRVKLYWFVDPATGGEVALNNPLGRWQLRMNGLNPPVNGPANADPNAGWRDFTVTAPTAPTNCASVTVKKVVTNVENDPTAFSGTITGTAGFSGLLETDVDGITVNAPVGVIITVAEVLPPPAGYTLLGYSIQDGSNATCRPRPDGPTPPTTILAAGESNTVCIYNEQEQINLTRTIRVGKVTDTVTHPGDIFNYTVSPANGTDINDSLTLAANGLASLVDGPHTVTTAPQTVTEGTPPTGWTLSGYNVSLDPNGTNQCSNTMAFSTAPGSNVVAENGLNYLVCIKNNYTPQTRVINVCKYVIDNGASPANEGATFSFSSNPAGTPASITAAGAENPQTINCTPMTVPNTSVTVSETPLAGWTLVKSVTFAGTGIVVQNAAELCIASAVTNVNGVLPANLSGILFCNRFATEVLPPDISVTKQADSDTVALGGTLGFVITVSNNGGSTATDVSLFDNLPGSGYLNYTIDAANTTLTGCAIGGLSEVLACGPMNILAGESFQVHVTAVVPSLIDEEDCGFVNNTAVAILPVGEGREERFFSEQVFVEIICDPNITIIKTADAPTAIPGGSLGFTITVSNPGVVTAFDVTLSDQLPGASFLNYAVVPPTTFPVGDCTVDVNDLLECGPTDIPAGQSRQVHVQAVVPTNLTTSQCITLNNQAEATLGQVESPGSLDQVAGPVTSNIASTTIVCDPGTSILIVRKVLDNDGDGVQDAGEPFITWTATVTGPSFPGGQAFTITGGNLSIPNLLAGNYTVVEATDPNYKAIGATSQQANVPANGSATVTFYNQPRVNIQANKTLVDNGVTSIGSGWTFTLTGCGVPSQSKITGASGSVLFTDLPPAVGCVYTVTETTQAGWTPDFVSAQVSPTAAGSTATVTFINRRFNITIVTPTPPVATPTTPPATVTQPAVISTPTAVTTTEVQTPASNTTAISVETPKPPVTGTGVETSRVSDSWLLMVAGAMFAAVTGFSLIAMGRKRVTNDR